MENVSTVETLQALVIFAYAVAGGAGAYISVRLIRWLYWPDDEKKKRQ